MRFILVKMVTVTHSYTRSVKRLRRLLSMRFHEFCFSKLMCFDNSWFIVLFSGYLHSKLPNGGGENRSHYLFSTNIFRLSYRYWPRNDLTVRGGGGGILNVIVKLFLLLPESHDGNGDIGRF